MKASEHSASQLGTAQTTKVVRYIALLAVVLLISFNIIFQSLNSIGALTMLCFLLSNDHGHLVDQYEVVLVGM